jgi:hypothetical protein
MNEVVEAPVIESPATEYKKVMISKLVREVFLNEPNPDTLDWERLMILVRAKVANAGGDPSLVKKHQVKQERQRIRKMFGEITNDTTQKYIDYIANGEWKRKDSMSGRKIKCDICGATANKLGKPFEKSFDLIRHKAMAHKKTKDSEPSHREVKPRYTAVLMIKAAKCYVSACGGLDQAQEVLTALKEAIE